MARWTLGRRFAITWAHPASLQISDLWGLPKAWMDVAPTGQTWRCLDKLDFAFPPSISVSAPWPCTELRVPPWVRGVSAIRVPFLFHSGG